MPPRFFAPGVITPGEFVLTGPEAHHLANVRRCVVGDHITLFNGDGREFPADVIAVSKKQVLLHVTGVESPARELPFSLEIAAAMPKGDRGDFLIEKLVELGVTRFTPLETQRSVAVPKANRIENLRQAVIEASKQCGRNVLMQVSDVMTWKAFLARTDLPSRKFMLTTQATQSFAGDPGDMVLAIGPEGDWDAKEIEAATQSGWSEMSLGPRILRVETAAIAASALVSLVGWAESARPHAG